MALLRAGADPNARNLTGSFPIHEAALSGCAALADALLAAGGNPNAANARKKTPLQEAAASGWRKIAEELLLSGASPRAMDAAGRTRGKAAGNRGHAELAQRLGRAEEEAAKGNMQFQAQMETAGENHLIASLGGLIWFP